MATQAVEDAKQVSLITSCCKHYFGVKKRITSQEIDRDKERMIITSAWSVFLIRPPRERGDE